MHISILRGIAVTFGSGHLQGYQIDVGVGCSLYDQASLGGGSIDMTLSTVAINAAVGPCETIHLHSGHLYLMDPSEFHGVVDIAHTDLRSPSNSVDIEGRATSWHFDTKHDLLTLYQGAKTMDTLRLLAPPPGTGALDWGVVNVRGYVQVTEHIGTLRELPQHV